MTSYRGFIVTLTLSIFGAAQAEAEIVRTLSDLNSTVQFDLGTGGVGMDQWTVEGVNQLQEQSFWYRVGNAPAQRINSLNLVSDNVSPGMLTATYMDPGSRFKIDLKFILTGAPPGTGQSDIAESVRTTSTSSSALDFHLYEYVDLNLSGTPLDSSVSISGGNTAIQTEGDSAVSETSDVPYPSRYQADYQSTILNGLTGGVLNLTNGTSATNGDLAWAFQWDRSIPAGGSFLVSKDKLLTVATVVPEPSTLALLTAAGLGLAGWAWRRKQPA
jgi:hypothetical protein